MQAGRLRHRGTIEAPTGTAQDRHGGPVPTWEVFKHRLPMRVNELTGRELFNAQQIQPDITMSVELRWCDGVTSRMRINWHDRGGDRELSIEAPPINPDGRKRGMTLLCKEAK